MQLCVEASDVLLWLLAAIPEVVSVAVAWVLFFTMVQHSMQVYTVSSYWYVGCFGEIKPSVVHICFPRTPEAQFPNSEAQSPISAQESSS